jgi:hypothetical protein
MVPVELISMLGGSVTGFLFRYWAQKRENDKELFLRLIEANKTTTKNQDLAAERVPIDIGKGVRQTIVLAILFGTVLAPFILPFFGIPTFVEVDTIDPESFFGLVSTTTKKYFVEINGFLYATENRQVLVAIVGFYFGSAAAAAKS